MVAPAENKYLKIAVKLGRRANRIGSAFCALGIAFCVAAGVW